MTKYDRGKKTFKKDISNICERIKRAGRKKYE